MEQKYSVPVDKVLALLTDPRFVETRSLALGELAAKVKVKKAAGKIHVTMERRARRELPALIAKVMPSESDLHFEEVWTPEGDGYSGKLTMTITGQPVTMSADFSLRPAGKGCVYAIEHKSKCSLPLIGGTVARFVQGQVEQGCAAEFKYTVDQIKSGR